MIKLFILSLLFIANTQAIKKHKKHHHLIKTESEANTFTNLNLEWTKPSYFNDGLDDSIQIYETKTSIADGVPLNAFYAEIDLKNSDLDFKVIYNTDKEHTLSQYYEQYEGAQVLINGGFYDKETGESISLIVEDHQKLVDVIINQSDDRHPTIGAIGKLPDQSIETTWTFMQDQKLMKVDQPNFNAQEIPQNGQLWDVDEAMGAGPILIKNGQKQDGTFELFNEYIMNERHPRSSVCINDKGNLVFTVIDGRNPLSEGAFLSEEADLLHSIGCVDALNLDGGGSASLFANNMVINHPSEGQERPVSTALLVYKKQKGTLENVVDNVSDSLFG